MKGLAGKTVLVTGATSGIGLAIAVRFATEGANVAINYRNDAAKAETTRSQIQKACQNCDTCCGREFAVEADVSQAEDVIRMIRETIDEFGRLDILINNAGIQLEEASHAVEMEDFDKVLQVNLRGAYLCAREAIQQFLKQEQGGTIINVSSVHEIIPRPRYVSYAISKGGMGNLTKTLALEYADRGIRVNAIAPGATVTEINADWVKDPEKHQKMANKIPLGRVGMPEEMAAATAFLASEEAAYITGQTLFIDGGLTLYPSFENPHF
jgi:glucose 1-dehydrogenase